MSQYFPQPEECGRHTIFPGVDIRTRAGIKTMLSIVEFEPHSVVEQHSHPHEQVGAVLEGRAIFTIGAESKTLVPGDIYIIPGDVPHKVVALEERVRALDVFCPIREQYL
jgi:quercetin dioxygenase-like cupin family protein